jgi:hypothetical protein
VLFFILRVILHIFSQSKVGRTPEKTAADKNTPETQGVGAHAPSETKKMLASKIKTTYFYGANNSTPFFALVMPSGVTRSIVLLNRSFKRTSPVYDKIGKQIESQSRQNLYM